jgi:hypothetical protein
MSFFFREREWSGEWVWGLKAAARMPGPPLAGPGLALALAHIQGVGGGMGLKAAGRILGPLYLSRPALALALAVALALARG